MKRASRGVTNAFAVLQMDMEDGEEEEEEAAAADVPSSSPPAESRLPEQDRKKARQKANQAKTASTALPKMRDGIKDRAADKT